MARRRRRKAAPRSAPNIWLIAFQIAILVVALIAVIALRDGIGSGAGALVESLTSEDIAVESQSSEDAPTLPADQTDDEPDDTDENSPVK